jgi:flagellar protein FlaG
MAIDISTVGDGVTKTEHLVPTRVKARKSDPRPVPTEQADFEPQEIERSVAALEKAMRHFDRRISLNYSREINRVIVRVLDGSSDRVIREIPTSEIQRLIARIRETIGVLIDEQR